MTAQQQAALEHLGRLTELGRLGEDYTSQCSYGVEGVENGIQLFQMGATDADMEHFALLPGWVAITLRQCPVSDTGFKHLTNQDGLKFLDIAETEITTLHPIRECIHLQQLWCDRLERLTDQKAAALANFSELWFLDLAWTDTGDATAERLAVLTALRKLSFLGTKITDEGIRTLGKLPNLEMLNLYRTEVTDEGLGHLHGLSNLRVLAIGETPVTKNGRAAIERACPNLKVKEYIDFY